MESYVVIAALAVVIGMILLRPIGLSVVWTAKGIQDIVWTLILWVSLFITSVWLARWVFHITKC
jgi:hypothetical protein